MDATVIGELPDTVGHAMRYWRERGCKLDCRGPLTIHPESNWGFFVTVITRSHDIASGTWKKGVDRPVVVESNVWIGSGSLLYDCIIREGAIVAAGSVVCSCEVGPRVIVAGNPAKVVARWQGYGWLWEASKWRVLS